jgi:hypothetical protein
MLNEEERALKCERLATTFDQAAEKDVSRATEFRRWADQNLLEVAEHPQAPKLRTRAIKLMEAVAYWEERAAWARKMAGRFRRRAEEHWTRNLSG